MSQRVFIHAVIFSPCAIVGSCSVFLGAVALYIPVCTPAKTSNHRAHAPRLRLMVDLKKNIYIENGSLLFGKLSSGRLHLYFKGKVFSTTLQ